MAQEAAQFGNWGLNWTKAKLGADYKAFRDKYAPGIPDEVMTPVTSRDIKIENEEHLIRALHTDAIRREFNRRLVVRAIMTTIGLHFYLTMFSIIGIFTKGIAVVSMITTFM